MKNKKVIFTLAVLILAVFVSSVIISTNADYSATNDPLVTLSYINETLIPKLEKQITESVLATLNSEKEPTGEEPSEQTQSPAPETPSQDPNSDIPTTPTVDLNGLKYIVVHLTKGQKLFSAGENTESLEIILRAGNAEAISPFTDQGIADLTASLELLNGDSLVKNNYTIIPRGQDGRGILVTSQEAYFLVRGVYSVE